MCGVCAGCRVGGQSGAHGVYGTCEVYGMFGIYGVCDMYGIQGMFGMHVIQWHTYPVYLFIQGPLSIIKGIGL
jgi:hypothetical protein